MNPYIEELAEELASKINAKVNLPWLNEEQEQIFFRLVITKLFEILIAQVMSKLQSREETD